MRKEFKINGNHDDEDIIFNIPLTKSNSQVSNEISNYIFQKILLNLLVLAKKYNTEEEWVFYENMEILNENCIFLNDGSIKFVFANHPVLLDNNDEIRYLYQFVCSKILEVNWRQRILSNEKEWSLVQSKAIALLEKLDISADTCIESFILKIDDDFLYEE